MDSTWPLLSVLIWLPILGGLLTLAFGDARAPAAKVFALPIRVLENKYGFDDLWIKGFAGGGIKLGKFSWKRGDAGLIDGLLVNGSAVLVDRVAGVLRQIQTGRLYNYAFAMILGLIVLLAVLVKTVGA